MSKDPKHYYKSIDEEIRKSLTFEQKRAVMSSLNDIHKEIKIPNKLIEIKFSFWFIKKYYIFFCLGKERRNLHRTKDGTKTINSFILFIHFLLLLLFIVLLLIGVFYLLYTIKCFLGINLFSDFHLRDILPSISNF